MVEDEFRSLTAWGEKLLSKLEVWQWTLLHLLPDGSRVNRLWLGRVFSFSIRWALCRYPPSLKSLMFWAVMATCCRAFHSWAVIFPVPDAFYCFSVKFDGNLTLKCTKCRLLQFHRGVEPFVGFYQPGWWCVMTQIDSLWCWFPGT